MSTFARRTVNQVTHKTHHRYIRLLVLLALSSSQLSSAPGCFSSPVPCLAQGHRVISDTDTRAYGASSRLPVAASFNQQINWQSNGSRCDRSIANAYRSLRRQRHRRQGASSTGRCWTGFCILGFRWMSWPMSRGEYEPESHHLARSQRRTVSGASTPLQRPGRRYIVNFSRERISGPRRTSFADRRPPRSRGSRVRARRRSELPTVAVSVAPVRRRIPSTATESADTTD